MNVAVTGVCDDGRRTKWNGFLMGLTVVSVFGLPFTMMHAGTVPPPPSLALFGVLASSGRTACLVDGTPSLCCQLNIGAIILSFVGTAILFGGMVSFLYADLESAGDDLYSRV